MVRRITTICFLVLTLSLICGSLAFAVADYETEKGSTNYTDNFATNMKQLFLNDWKVNSRITQLFGYDNNVYLNPQRRGSEFIETIWNLGSNKDLNKYLQGSLEYQFSDMIYTGAGRSSFYKNFINAGLNTKSMGKFTYFTDLSFEWLDFPRDDDSSNNGARYDIGVRQKITQKLYHKFSYEFYYKYYWKRGIHDGNYIIVDADPKRHDVRNTYNYEIGMYFKKFLVTMFSEIYKNVSNESYEDFYDYDSYKFGSTLTYLFTKKLTGYLSLAHQSRFYDGRGTIADPTITADDRTYLAYSAFLYKLTDKVTAQVSYSYRENTSKEPSQKYSGSTIAAGVSYKF